MSFDLVSSVVDFCEPVMKFKVAPEHKVHTEEHGQRVLRSLKLEVGGTLDTLHGRNSV